MMIINQLVHCFQFGVWFDCVMKWILLFCTKVSLALATIGQCFPIIKWLWNRKLRFSSFFFWCSDYHGFQCRRTTWQKSKVSQKHWSVNNNFLQFHSHFARIQFQFNWFCSCLTECVKLLEGVSSNFGHMQSAFIDGLHCIDIKRNTRISSMF